MSQLFEGWEGYMRNERLASPRTIARYRRVLSEFERFLADEHGEEPFALEAIDTATLKQFLRQQAEQSDAPSRSSWNVRLMATTALDFAWLPWRFTFLAYQARTTG